MDCNALHGQHNHHCEILTECKSNVTVSNRRSSLPETPGLTAWQSPAVILPCTRYLYCRIFICNYNAQQENPIANSACSAQPSLAAVLSLDAACAWGYG